jgi:LacI family transcriptional regulator
MQMQDRPTAVVIMNNTMAMGAYRFFKNNQIKVPDEISVASFVDIENADLMYVRPCVATMNPWIVGRKAGELILDRIKGINNNREVIYESQVIPGDSVKPLTAW